MSKSTGLAGRQSSDALAAGDQICGDCDGNGSTDVLDALFAAQVPVGLISLGDGGLTSCDVNDTGHVEGLDALRIALFLVGSVPLLTCP